MKINVHYLLIQGVKMGHSGLKVGHSETVLLSQSSELIQCPFNLRVLL